MTADERMSTIRRDVLYVVKRIERAKELARAGGPHREIWGELDRAEAQLHGLSFFIGPWEPELVADQRP